MRYLLDNVWYFLLGPYKVDIRKVGSSLIPYLWARSAATFKRSMPRAARSTSLSVCACRPGVGPSRHRDRSMVWECAMKWRSRC